MRPHNASIFETLISILALVRGQPSGVRLDVLNKDEEVCQAGGSPVCFKEDD